MFLFSDSFSHRIIVLAHCFFCDSINIVYRALTEGFRYTSLFREEYCSQLAFCVIMWYNQLHKITAGIPAPLFDEMRN